LLDLSALTIATSSPEGNPHAATVYFVCDAGLIFYFLSARTSQHVGDLVVNSLAAITLFPLVPTWQEIRGLQMRGRVTEITSATQQTVARTRYQAKFPFLKDLDSEYIENLWWSFTPDWVRWTDNRLGFGFKQEWSGHDLHRLIEDRPSR
jgi:uncharacterized protein YhbP (UPF0306 family)